MPLQVQQVQAFEWSLWRRVFGFALMPPKVELDRQIAELSELGRNLWQTEWLPLLGAEFALLFAEDADQAHRTMAIDFQRVGATAYLLSRALCEVHCRREDAAHAAGLAAMWMAVAAAVMDYLIDSAQVTPSELQERFSPEHVREALLLPPSVAPYLFDAMPCPPPQRFLMRLVERGFRSIRELMWAAPVTPFQERLRYEILVCLESMVSAELRSPMLRMDATLRLSDVERELRLVNTLTVWLSAYIGLLGAPEPTPDQVAALQQVTTMIGEIGWMLDSLSDVCEDLQQGVFNLAWLQLARRAAPSTPTWLTSIGTAPELALAALQESPVLDSMLSRMEVLIAQLSLQQDLPAEASRKLSALCRFLVWSFLVPRCPEVSAVAQTRS